MNQKYMQLALDLAQQGKYTTAPNPMVGCVVVKNDRVVASGYHQKFGKAHAEINALSQINFTAKNCDIYITLEPCSHFGQTPPCVDVIIKAQPSRVIIASIDPNPKVASIKKMQQAGIEVITGVLEQQAQELNCGFFNRMQKNKPFVTAKVAISIDGKIAMSSGQSKWLTGAKSRADVQKLRAENQAIITGSGTIKTDNPRLDVRDKKLPSPIKVVLSNNNKFKRNLNIFANQEPIITNKSPQDVLTMLAEMQINNVLLECGGKLLGSFLKLELIDKMIVYQAPIIMGSDAKDMAMIKILAMDNTINFKLQSTECLDEDIKIIYVK